MMGSKPNESKIWQKNTIFNDGIQILIKNEEAAVEN